MPMSGARVQISCLQNTNVPLGSQVAFNRVARGMLHQDHITFAMLLARIKLKGTLG